MPFLSASSTPFSIAGMYSFGMRPPTTSFSKTKPPPGGSGSSVSQQWPYWPRPPDWRTDLPSLSPVLRIAQRRAGDDVRDAHARRDVAGAHFLDLAALVGVHLDQAADALPLAADRIEYGRARDQHTGIVTDEGQRADVLVGHDLERQR